MVDQGITRFRMKQPYFNQADFSELITPSKSHVIILAPAACGSSSQSGTYQSRSGEIQLSTDDTVHMFLTGLLPYLYAGGKLKIETITVFYGTDLSNTDYITKASIESYDPTDGSYTEEWSDPDDVGKASTGRSSYPYTPNYVSEADKTLCLKIEAIVASRVYIYAVKIEFRLVKNAIADGTLG